MRELPRQLSADELAGLFEGRTRFVERLAREPDPLTRAATLVQELPRDEQIEVLATHPAIGQRAGLSARSAAEQGADADPEVLAELARLNAEYEARHGFRFVVFVDRRPKHEVLGVLRTRIERSSDDELATALGELVRDRGRPLAAQLGWRPMLKITAGSFAFRARLEREAAPQTVAAFGRLLPLRSRIIHVRWSGEAGWIPFGDLDLGLGPENATCYPHPGEIVLYPGGVSETEILLAYGYVNFASQGRAARRQPLRHGHRAQRPAGRARPHLPLGRRAAHSLELERSEAAAA